MNDTVKNFIKVYYEWDENEFEPQQPFAHVSISDLEQLVTAYAAAPQKGMKEVDHEAEKEVMMQAFDKVYKIFQARTWVMEGRGSYRYDDDRYKEEVRYLFDEFDAIHKDTWKNIKSKSADFRLKVIEQYKKDLKNPYIRLSETGTLDESPSPSEAGDGWSKEKPTFKEDCILLTASWWKDHWETNRYEVIKTDGEDEDYSPCWYWALLQDDQEWGDIEDLQADLYKVISFPAPPIQK